MKLFLLSSIVLLSVLFHAKANDTLTIKHTYQSKNVFVQNPYGKDLKSFCTIKVLVNDSTVMENIQTSAYEIDLSWVKINTTVKIRIVHQSGCKPVVMNSILCFPSRAFQFVSIKVDEKEWSFTTKGEAKGEKILIESFQNGTWVLIKEVPSKGSAIINEYIFPSQNNSGKNKVRIKHMNGDGYLTYSKEIEYSF